MKTLKQISILFLMALAFTACGSDDDTTTEEGGDMGGAGEEFFTASVDGRAFAAATDLETLIGGSLSGSGATTVLVAQGSTNTGDYINFNIIGFTGAGTYPVGNDIANNNGISYGELSRTSINVWTSNGIIAITGVIEPGQIIVSSQDDDGAEGTFSFQGYNGNDMSVKNVTTGTFKVIFDN